MGGFGGGRDVWAGGRRSKVLVIADEVSILASRCVRERGRERERVLWIRTRETHCSRVALCYSIVWCVAVRCSVPPCVAVCGSV